MPGINLIHYFHKQPDKAQTSFETLLDGIIYQPEYKRAILLNDDNTFLGVTHHVAYPVRTYEDRNFFVCLEGVIYGKNEQALHDELIALCQIISVKGNHAQTQLTNWLKNTDGEFVIFIKDKINFNIFLINDLLGLLPCYYRMGKDRIIFARELRFITNCSSEIHFDRYALAQYLILDYALGNKLLFENIYRFPPATLLSIGFKQKSADFLRLYQRNCEEEKHANRNLDENSDALVSIFDQVCRHRVHQAQGTTLILSMSGGRDSRAVCAGLFRAGAAFNGVTFHYGENRNAQGDVDVARSMAQKFGVPWQLVELNAPFCKDVLELLNIKSGLNNLRMAFVVRFLKIVRSLFKGPLTYATGDIGLAPWDTLPSINLRTMDDLFNYIIRHCSVFSPQAAAKLLGLKQKDIIEQLRSNLEAFPERDFNRKLIQLYISGRSFKWNYEGMDRNRYYSWLMVPQESPLFVDYGFNCPPEQKKGFRLQDNFLHKLSEKNRGFKLVEYDAPAGTAKMLYKMKTRALWDNLSSGVRQMIKTNILRNWSVYAPDALPVRMLDSILDNCSAAGQIFNKTEIQTTLRGCSKEQFNTIFTLAAVIEQFTCQSSILERHLEKHYE